MAWKVHEIVEANFRGKPHRFLEFESDITDELDGLVARSVEKGWAEYVTGARVGANLLIHIHMRIFLHLRCSLPRAASQR